MLHSARKWSWVLAAITTVFGLGLALAQGAGYNMPPAPIAQILDAPPTPAVDVDPTRATLALLARASLPAIAELAEGELRLAGYRINPRNNGIANSRTAWFNGLSSCRA